VQAARQRGAWVDKMAVYAAAGPALLNHPEYHGLGEFAQGELSGF
jgi:hypothetical protein